MLAALYAGNETFRLEQREPQSPERTAEAFEALGSGADVVKVLIDCRAGQ